MRNNKLTRKRAQRLAAKQMAVDVLPNGTEVLKTRESRAKQRRWSFEADVTIMVDTPTKEGESAIDPIAMPLRTLKLDTVSYSTAKEAVADCATHEAYLRSTNPLFAKAKIRVRAVPHETVSHATLNQLSGYRDMAMILDKALELAVTEAEDVVLNKAFGNQFVQREAVEASDETLAKPARTTAVIKEEFYKRALETFKPKEEPKAEVKTESDPHPELENVNPEGVLA